MAAVDFQVNPTTTTTYNDTVYAAIISNEVMDALMALVVTPQLLNNYSLAGQPSDAVNIPKADKFTAAGLTEGTELANTALTTGVATLTAAEIGIMATVTDVLDLSDIPAAQGARLRQLGRSLGDKLDVDVCALFQAFSTVVGTSGSVLTTAQFMSTIYNLEAADAPKPFVGALHPAQIDDLRTDLVAGSNAGALIASSIRGGSSELGQTANGQWGSLFDIPIFTSTNIPTVNAGADRGGAVFSRNYALGMATKYMSRVETLRWPPIRGWVLVATSFYGVGEIEDAAGVAVVTDA